jgi:hypothetical protein
MGIAIPAGLGSRLQIPWAFHETGKLFNFQERQSHLPTGSRILEPGKEAFCLIKDRPNHCLFMHKARGVETLTSSQI